MMIWGVHVHVGIDDGSKALPILNALLVHLPRFQALSASSPFWSGQETGYASNRALMFQQLPTAGLPPDLTTWADYERLVGDMTHVGVIDHHSELRWDIRPAPKWGTLETRVFDGVSTLGEIASLAALVQCLVHDMSAALDRGEELPRMQPWFVRENKWRAARYGMDAIIIQDAAGEEALVGDDTRARGAPLPRRRRARLRGGAARDPRHRRPRRELPAAAPRRRGPRRRARTRGHAPGRGAALRIGPVTRGRLSR
jgi:carboxylate-amine ligase